MSTRIVAHFFLPSLLVGLAFGCSRGDTKERTREALVRELPPLVLSTKLSDTLSTKAVAALKLDKNCVGTKIKYYDGRSVSYFEYDADPDRVLHVLAQLPFVMCNVEADTTSRHISFASLEVLKASMRQGEIETAGSFWKASESDYEAFECVKAPLVHTVLINRKSHHVLHRVEVIG